MARRILVYTTLISVLVAVSFPIANNLKSTAAVNRPGKSLTPLEIVWQPPDINLLPNDQRSEKIRYGKDLIANTAAYLGPNGRVAKLSNGLSCQNCHLEAGTRLFGNNYAKVAYSYPKYRQRSGRVETLAFRINECMQRSLNGKALDSNSKEMQAMIAYINWLGKNVNSSSPGHGIQTIKLPYINRAADTASGKQIYVKSCKSCHGVNGEGQVKNDSTSYAYPPLWGKNSYNVSAGIYRISSLAAFIKYNMPFTPQQGAPQLTDEEAWDVAAFINSQQRPIKFFKGDWSKLNTKPVDYPFGPYADAYSTKRHKYGPYIGMGK